MIQYKTVFIACMLAYAQHAYGIENALFSKVDSNGKRIEVFKKEVASEVNQMPMRLTTNLANGSITTKGFDNSYTTETYYVTVTDAGVKVVLTNRSFSLLHRPSAPTNAIVDILHEEDATVFLYRDFVGYPYHEPELLAKIVCPWLNKSMGYLRVWRPSDSFFSKVESARITGSYSKGTLAIEVIAMLDDSTYTITHRFIDGNWATSRQKLDPAKKGQEANRVKPRGTMETNSPSTPERVYRNSELESMRKSTNK